MTEAPRDLRRIARFNMTKRAIDLCILTVTAPLTIPMGISIGLLIRLRLGSPAIFRQVRPGKDEQPFELLKFRTMTDVRNSEGHLLPDRDRLTNLGAKLRAASLDELPQLINVARGDMSFVGPRPLLMSYLNYYSAEERKRHLVRPGITGLAQVSGRNRLHWDDRLAVDVTYVRNASLLTDLRIIQRTISQAIRGKDVSIVASDSGLPLHIERHYARTEGLILRRLTHSDLPQRVQWINDPRVRRYMQWQDDVTLESTRVWFEKVLLNPRRQDFVAVDVRTSAPVAMAGLIGGEPDAYEFYVFVDPDQQARGIGRQVTELAMSRASAVLGVKELTLTVARENAAALRIYRSVGFQVTDEDDHRVWMRRPCDN